MKRGRKPHPTRLKVLKGNPGKRPLNDAEPQPERVIPDCPEWLSPRAKDKWNLLVPMLHRVGLLTEADGDVVAAYCEAWADFRAATEQIQKDGHCTVTAAGGLKSHPAVQHKNQALQKLRELGALIGWSPSDRSRLHVNPTSDQASDLDQFLAGA